MRKINIILLLICFNYKFVQTEEIHLFSKPSSITVYPNGAVVNYKFNTNLKKGINKIIIDSLPSNLDNDLIQATLSGKNIIVTTEYIYDFNISKNVTKSEQRLKDSVKYLENYIDDIKSNIEGLKKEKILITDFKYEQKSEKINQFKELIDVSPLVGKRITELRKEINKYEKLEEEFIKKLTDVNLKLSYLSNSIYLSNESKLALEVLSESSYTSELNLSYFTTEASWALIYDLKVENINSPLVLVYKAMLKQKSGVNWENVALTFSNKSLEVNSSLPKPNIWFVKEEAKRSIQELQSTARFGINQVVTLEAGIAQNGSGFSIRGARDTQTKSYSNVNSNNLNVEFKLNSNITIKSNDQYYGLTVDTKEIPAIYSHYTYPSNNSNAFIIAQITNWSNLNLLGGEAFIYFENSYIGKTEILPNEVKDTLDIVLGVDKNIAITREITEEMMEDKFLSSNKIQYKGYKIKVRNNSKNNVNIKVLENYPVSASENIKINLLETSNAENNKETGLLTWIKKIEPNKSEDLKIIYKIEAPEGFKLKP